MVPDKEAKELRSCFEATWQYLIGRSQECLGLLQHERPRRFARGFSGASPDHCCGRGSHLAVRGPRTTNIRIPSGGKAQEKRDSDTMVRRIHMNLFMWSCGPLEPGSLRPRGRCTQPRGDSVDCLVSPMVERGMETAETPQSARAPQVTIWG